mgnify:FL=1|tara:strand:- start:701 stop:2788 length:2088 start_codon:yes stop_codon:yes gene_type:complete
MDYTILECRQQSDENTIVTANGDWETVLSDQILIEDGDQIAVSNSFIDTTLLTTSKVSIEEDTIVKMKIGFYNNLFQGFTDTLTTTGIVPDMPFYTLSHENKFSSPALDHYLCKYSYLAGPTHFLATNIHIILADGVENSLNLNVGDIMLQLEYTGFDGFVHSLSLYIPKYNTISRPDTTVSYFRINIPATECQVGYVKTDFNNGFRLVGMTDDELATKYKIKIDYANIVSIDLSTATDPPQNHFNIVENQISITIPQGQYEPSELAEYINNQVDDFTTGFGTVSNILSTSRIPDDENAGTNWGYKQGESQTDAIRRVKPLMTTANNLPMMLPYDAVSNPTAETQEGAYVFISCLEDENAVHGGYTTYPNTSRGTAGADPPNRWQGSANRLFIGSNQFTMEYDGATGRYRFTYLHMPLYLASNPIAYTAPLFVNNPATPFVPNNAPAVPPEFKYTAHNSGVFFTQMTPQTFWEDKLGLDLKKMLLTPITKEQDHMFNGSIGKGSVAYDVVSYIPAPQLREGVKQRPQAGLNTTDGLVGYDVAILKPVTVAAHPTQNSFFPWQEQVFDGAVPTKVLIGTESVYVDGKKSVIDQIISSGYYLLDIQSKFNTKFVSSKSTQRSINQIINRYYSLNTYTSAENSDLVYTHRGEPVYLSSLKIRVLNPDQTLASVGTDNTVFVKIAKAQKRPQTNEVNKK